MVFDLGAVEFGDDSVGVFGGDVHEEVAFADVHGADDEGWEAGFAKNGVDDIASGDARFFTDIHVET